MVWAMGSLWKNVAYRSNQLHRVLQKLVDAGAIDEMELFMRTSLDDSAITKAFAEIRGAVQELHNPEEVAPPRDFEAPSEITITEKVKTLGKVARGLVSKLARTG